MSWIDRRTLRARVELISLSLLIANRSTGLVRQMRCRRACTHPRTARGRPRVRSAVTEALHRVTERAYTSDNGAVNRKWPRRLGRQGPHAPAPTGGAEPRPPANPSTTG